MMNKNNFVNFTPFIKKQNFERSPVSIYFHEKLFSLIDLLSKTEQNLASIIEKHLNEVPRKSSGILEEIKMVSLDQKESLRIITAVKSLSNNLNKKKEQPLELCLTSNGGHLHSYSFL